MNDAERMCQLADISKSKVFVEELNRNSGITAQEKKERERARSDTPKMYEEKWRPIIEEATRKGLHNVDIVAVIGGAYHKGVITLAPSELSSYEKELLTAGKNYIKERGFQIEIVTSLVEGSCTKISTSNKCLWKFEVSW